MTSDSSQLEGAIVLLTGPMAAGKSTIAEALAATFARGVHVEGDVFRRFIVSGRCEMTPEPVDAAFEQLRLRYRLTAQTAEHYAASGYTVVVEDVVAGSLLGEFLKLFSHRPLHLVVLIPGEEAITEREAGRGVVGYDDWTISSLHHVFAKETSRVGLWLDTSTDTPEETVARIRSRASESALP